MSRPPTSAGRRHGRAAPMARDDRRKAIVDAVVPLLLEHGDGVTTRQIADAAGVAEGTIFGVFPDKAALLLAIAEETMNPSTARAEIVDALDGISDLRRKVLVTTERLNDRSEQVMAVMIALRRAWMSQPPNDRHNKERPPGPPQFVIEANRALLTTLTEVFEPHHAELAVEPRTAALLLRTLVLGCHHPAAHDDQPLTPDSVADALLNGILNRPTGIG